MMRKYFRLPGAAGNFVFIFLLILAACHQAPPMQTPERLPDEQQRLPENAIKGLKIDEGLYATLFASEPMITNPTNMDIDAKGRIWICEGYNYRPELNPGDPVDAAGDKILILEDRDGDGVADTAKVFYQGNDVNAALGICILGNRVIVSCSPKVFVFTDTDGDDKADKKEVLFEGIGGYQHDHGIHAFTFGPDGKLYFDFGNWGDSILDKNGEAIRDRDGNMISNKGKPYREGMAFRCNPDGSEVEVLGYNFRNPYEIAVDAFGNLWQSDNDDDGNKSVRINYVMKYGNYGYTDEMTGAGWRAPRINMEDSIPFRHWHLNDPGVVPNLLQTGAGAPTGILVYEGGLLPPVFQNQIIHADALGNVIRAYPVEKDGAGYKAETVNIVEGIYDKWFRPSDVCVAPDGSLFITDWYDPGVGGHQVEDLDRGRIYRIAPPGAKYRMAPPALDTPEQAVRALESPNLATRYLAWEKLHEWGEKAVPALERLFSSGNPRYRARALWLLSKIPGKGMQYVNAALKDKDEDIRVTAVRAAEELPGEMIPVIEQAADDPSAQVRRTAAVALHHNHSPEAPALWTKLAERYDGRDRWYLEALGIGADGQWDTFLKTWLEQTDNGWNTISGRDIVWRARTKEALPLLAEIINDPGIDPPGKLKFFRSLDFYSDSAKQAVLSSLLMQQKDIPGRQYINALIFTQIDPARVPQGEKYRDLLAQSPESVSGKPEYLSLIEKYHLKGKNEELMRMVLDVPSEDLRAKALGLILHSDGRQLVERQLHGDERGAQTVIEALGREETRTNKDLLQALVVDNRYPPALRKAAARSLGRGWSGEDRLLALSAAKAVPPEIDSIAANVLLHASRKEVRTKAMALFKTGNNKGTALAPIAQLAALKGDPGEGKTVFNTYCASCHRVHKEGTDFGPDLSEIGGKLAKEAIYKAIITPDDGISFGYDGYTFTLKNGKEILGYITSETAGEVAVKVIGGAVEKIPAADILSRKAYAHSLMPSGLATAMPQAQLVDLVAYLSGLKKAD